jgi:hypothetical protein
MLFDITDQFILRGEGIVFVRHVSIDGVDVAGSVIPE